MCGRFVRKRSTAELARAFDVEEVADELPPSFNIAPTHDVSVIIERPVRRLMAMKWGLVPYWASDPKGGAKLINARSETLTTKSAFKEAFKKRRCIIPADGFFEWEKRDRNKYPLLIRLKTDLPFAFAGLYEVWRPPLGDPLRTCTIITTDANELLRPIHDRMPVILPAHLTGAWLDPSIEDPRRLLDLLQPYPDDEMEAFEVSTLVNSVKNNSPECIERTRTSLFDID